MKLCVSIAVLASLFYGTSDAFLAPLFGYPFQGRHHHHHYHRHSYYPNPFDPYYGGGNPYWGGNPLGNMFNSFMNPFHHNPFHFHRPNFHSRYYPRFPTGPHYYPHPPGLPRHAIIRPHWPYRWRPYLPRLPRYRVRFPRFGRPYVRPTFSAHLPHWPHRPHYLRHHRHFNPFHPAHHIPRYQRHQLRRIFGPHWRHYVNNPYHPFHRHLCHHLGYHSRPHWYRRWRYHMHMHRLKRKLRHHYRHKLRRMQRRMMYGPMSSSLMNPSMSRPPFYNNFNGGHYGRFGQARTIWLPEFYNGHRWIPHHPYLRPHPSVFYGPVHHHHFPSPQSPFDMMMGGGGPSPRTFVY